jgi:exosortase/archaeosortase family protein
MIARHGCLLLLAAAFALGWLAAAGAAVTLWEQAAAAGAALLVLGRARGVAAPPAPWAAGALILAALGLALGWAWPAAVAAAGLAARAQPAGLPRARAVALALLAVPWIATDAAALGWVFRLTGAWAAGGFFDLAGLHVVREGTMLLVEDQPLAVDAACAGLDTLQATLVAGFWLAETLRTGRRWAFAALALPLLAWLANALRIVLLGSVALTAGTEAATGWFHTWGGLVVVVLVFLLAGLWVAFLRWTEPAPRP